MINQLTPDVRTQSPLYFAPVKVVNIAAKQVDIGERFLDKQNRARLITGITKSKKGKLIFHTDWPSVKQMFWPHETVLVIW